MPALRLQPAVLLDRDDTLNHDTGYVYRVLIFAGCPAP
jgi:histidinol phosphatase-like enzyme